MKGFKSKVLKAVEAALFLALTGAVFMFGFLNGSVGFEFILRAPGFSVAFGVVDAVMTSLTFTLFILLSASLTLYRMRKQRGLESGDGSITAVIPVYRDSEVLERSVKSVAESSTSVDTVVVCEPDDSASIEEAERLSEEYGIDYLVNDRYTGSKAGAVNYAVEETESEYIAVLDADEMVDEDFFGVASKKLDESYDVVQGRTIPEPNGWIESMAYYESVFLSYVSPRLLYILTGFRIAASRSTVIDREAFENIDGYSDEMLTEDFHFAFKCYRNRLDVYELLENPSRIEAAHSLKDWWGQRKRWMMGYVQTIIRLFKEINTDYRALTSAAIGASTLLGSVLMVSIISKFMYLIVMDAEVLALIPVATLFSCLAYFHHRDLSYGIKKPGLMLLLSPFVLPFYSLAALKATVEYFGTWTGEWYSVEKAG